MFEVTINIPGLKELAEAIMGISAGKNGAPVQGAAQSQQLPVQQAMPPIQQVPAQVQQTTPPVQHVPAQQITPPVQQTPTQQPPVQQSVPTTTPSYTLDDLARAAMTLMDTGRQAELQALLVAFGVNSLPELQPEKYGAFATALREKGAQI